MLKAAQAQGEVKKQSVAKKQVRERRSALAAAGIEGAEVDGLIQTLEDPAAREKLVTQLKALKAIGGPYVGVKFIPTGGISASNLADYLRLPMVHACGGSFMVKKQLIADGQFDTITQLAQTAVDIVKSART